MKVYYHAFYVPTEQLVPLAVRAEELGFDGCSLSDHIFFPKHAPRFEEQIAYWDTFNEFPKGVGAYTPQTEFPDAWVAYTAMASATTRLEFVSSVYILPLRHPIVVASAVATASVLSNNRIHVGVGAGWLSDEYPPMGQEWEKRGARMGEQVELIRALWSGESIEHHGRFYDVAGTLHQQPLSPMPKIFLGGSTSLGFKRAARLGDGFIGGRLPFERFTAAKSEIEAYRHELGVQDRPYEWLNALRHEEAVQRDMLKRFAEAGCDAVRVGPFDVERLPWGKATALETRLEALERYAESFLEAAHNP
jgi:alkanesulfonate monooxygenase SsuD/methylene tetrahydromethanopterin reductase-like flavin-dependent oxidoreductase (luciferase family)